MSECERREKRREGERERERRKQGEGRKIEKSHRKTNTGSKASPRSMAGTPLPIHTLLASVTGCSPPALLPSPCHLMGCGGNVLTGILSSPPSLVLFSSLPLSSLPLLYCICSLFSLPGPLSSPKHLAICSFLTQNASHIVTVTITQYIEFSHCHQGSQCPLSSETL